MDAPNATLKLAPGLHARQLEDGTTLVEPSGEHKTHTVAFRLTASGKAELMPFLDTFTNGQIGLAMRWLLEHPDVKRVMEERVAGATVSVARVG